MPIHFVPCPGCGTERVALVDRNVVEPPVSEAQRKLREMAAVPNHCPKCELLADELAKTDPELAAARQTVRRGRPLLFSINLKTSAACG